MTTRDPMNASERRALSELLPWYVSGKLDAADKARVEAALAIDPSLRDELEIVREDQDATLTLIDRMPTPSPRVLDALMKRVEAEPARLAHVTARAKAGFADWFGAKLSQLAPRTLAYAAGAAAIALVVQAGVIGSGFIGGGANFQTASHETAASGQSDGTFVLIGFTAQASAAEMTKLLEQVRGTIVDGPRPGGFYRVRVGARGMPQAQVDQALATLRGRADVVRFAGPSM
ncbi:hypothetical protein [Phreatobacter stygius]|uniref:Uncharacterized protein n=1 Tax=Phreatobacter stygius TaxID=1940610 RepID=A0A4D7B6Z8_9HYPH|nr:hypothetical protein [Phreatobacter stygius]QCI66100.1 hypothetical protein E8M01_18935 [Phreatobacter stygius]